MKPFEWPVGVTEERKLTVAQMLWTLHDLGGKVEDSSGRAVPLLTKEMKARGAVIPSEGIRKILNEFESGGVFGPRLVRQERSSTRTQMVALRVNPSTVPFPDDPFASGEPDEEEVEVVDDEVVDEVDEGLIRLEAVVRPGTDVAVPAEHGHPQPTAADALLFAMSAVNDAFRLVAAEQAASSARVVNEQIPRLSEMAVEMASLRTELDEAAERERVLLERNAALEETIRIQQRVNGTVPAH